MCSAKVKFILRADAEHLVPQRIGAAHVGVLDSMPFDVGHLLGSGRREHIQAGMDIGIIAQGGHKDVPLTVRIHVFEVHYHLHGLCYAKAFSVDDAHRIVVRISGWQLAGNAAGIGHVQLAVVIGDAFRLIAHLHGAIGLICAQVDTIYAALGVGGIGDGVVGPIGGEGSRPGGYVGVFIVKGNGAGRRNLDGGKFCLVRGGNHFYQAGIVDDHPHLVVVKGDVVAHVAQAGLGTGIHFLEGAGNILTVTDAQKIQCGVVGAQLAFVEHENLLVPVDFCNGNACSFEVRVLGRGSRHKGFPAGYNTEHAKSEKHQGFFHRIRYLR